MVGGAFGVTGGQVPEGCEYALSAITALLNRTTVSDPPPPRRGHVVGTTIVRSGAGVDGFDDRQPRHGVVLAGLSTGVSVLWSSRAIIVMPMAVPP